MKNAPSGTGKPHIPLPVNPEVDVVWSGSSTRYGEKGQLLPDTHNVGSTWNASVERIKRRIDAINRRDVDAG